MRISSGVIVFFSCGAAIADLCLQLEDMLGRCLRVEVVGRIGVMQVGRLLKPTVRRTHLVEESHIVKIW